MGGVVKRYIGNTTNLNNFFFTEKEKRVVHVLLILLHLYLLFFCSSIPTSLFILKIFFHSCLLFLCNIANVAQRTFKIIKKLRSCRHGNIIIRVPRLPCARY